MTTAHDIAAYILSKKGCMSVMKLQKLIYYTQAWSLVWDESPLFDNRIEAWANGPVVRDLYEEHKGRFELSNWPKGNPSSLTAKQQQTVDSVLAFYGDRSAQWLSDLTHREQPWIDARKGLSDAERGASEITVAAMMEYYSGLQ